MVSWIRLLAPMIIVTAAFAGCLGAESDVDPNDGGDDLPPANGNGNGNETIDNITAEPPKPPIPRWSVSISADGADPVSPPFVFQRGIDLDITLDGSATTAEEDDATIDTFVWDVRTPNGREERQAGGEATFTFNVTNLNTEHFGAYEVRLRVLSTAGAINETTGTFVLSMSHSVGLEAMMLGLGLADCGGHQGAATDPTQSGDYYFGTYRTHVLSVAPNVTKLDFTLTYSAGPNTEMRLYVYGQSADSADCGAALATSPAGASPLTFTVEALPEQTILGAYTIRVQMEGPQVEGYALDVVATYAVPGEAAPEEPAAE